MARYKALEKTFLNGTLYNPGDMVETDLAPGAHLEPWKDEKGREDRAAREAKDKAGEVIAPGHPKYFGNLVDHAMGDGDTKGRIEASTALPPAAPGVVVDETGQVRGIEG